MYHLNEICNKIDEEFFLLDSTQNTFVDKITTPLNADDKSLVFISPGRTDKQELFDKTNAAIVICDASIDLTDASNKCVIVVKDPKYLFAKLAKAFFSETPKYEIHPTAIIHPDAIIHPNVSIGSNTYIGKCEIKSNTIIYGNCYLYDNVEIAENVIIHAGAIIGAEGLGHIKGPDGRYLSFPHIGKVIIESHVEIGTNSCIAKGALNDTVIKKGTIIDSFVQVGHNVLIEENVLILANCVIGGSSIIKKEAVLAIGAHICDYITVGEKAHIGPGAIVINQVPPGAKVVTRSPMVLTQ